MVLYRNQIQNGNPPLLSFVNACKGLKMDGSELEKLHFLPLSKYQAKSLQKDRADGIDLIAITAKKKSNIVSRDYE